MALDIAQCNDERQRLEWSFRSDIVLVGKLENLSKLCRMWDVDDSGCINLQEMTNIVATMDDVEGVEQEPKVSPVDIGDNDNDIGDNDDHNYDMIVIGIDISPTKYQNMMNTNL